MTIRHWVRMTPQMLVRDGQAQPFDGTLAGLYRMLETGYPKFFKMDVLCKAGFLATECLLADESGRFVPREDRAVLLFSRSGCLCDDRHYADSMADYPSPALFVYTLANVVTGEICIRNRYQGESAAFLLPGFDAETLCATVEDCFRDRDTRSALVLWADCPDEQHFDVLALLAENGQNNMNKQSINDLYEYGRIQADPQTAVD